MQLSTPFLNRSACLTVLDVAAAVRAFAVAQSVLDVAAAVCA